MTSSPGQTARDPALSALGKQLDSGLWSAAGWLWGSLRSRWPRRPAFPRVSRLAALPGLASPTAEQLERALAEALRVGALESAGELCERLLALFPDLVGAPRPRMRELVLQALLVHGDRGRAERLARAELATLRSTAVGASLLELLGLGDDAPRLPNGRPHFLALSRRVASGKLNAEQLAALLGGQPWRWLGAPELNLLFCNARKDGEPAQAERDLNRFLAFHGLPRCALRASAAPPGSLLDALSFEQPPPVLAGPLVSVLMSARNASATLGYAVTSLLEQSYRRLELLICDDASDDGTLDLLRRYQRDPRVRLFRSVRNQGAYNVRNALSLHARGELLAFHDADDLALPSRIAAQVERVSRPGVRACVANWVRVAPQSGFVFFRDQKAVRLALVSLMLKRELFEELGPFRPARVGADLELYSSLRARLGSSALSRIDAPLIFGLWSSASATRSPGTEALEDGYRAPARRCYAQLVCAKHLPGYAAPSEQEIQERLTASGNYLEPTGVIEL